MSGSQKIRISNSPGASIQDVHYQSGAGAAEATAPRLHTKVLFLGANPITTPRLRLDNEVKLIEEALRASRMGDHFDLEQMWAVGDRDLQDGLLRHQPDILHLSGHGTEAGRLVLEPDAGTRVLGAPGLSFSAQDNSRIDALGRMFSVAHGRIRCVVLNACYSVATASVIAAHVGCVIGMSQEIGDSAAARFSWSFYNALGYGANVKDAFELAAAQVILGGLSPGAEVPRLLAPSIDPASIVFGKT